MALIEKCQQITNKVIESRWFIPTQFAITAAALISGLNVAGSAVLLLAAVLLLVFSDDTLSALCPVFFIIMAVTSFYRDYYALTKYAWAAAPFALALAVHFICYRSRRVRGRLLLPMCAVSTALLVGGAGTIPKNEYFSALSAYYVLGLGAVLTLIYALICPRLAKKRGYDIAERFASLLYALAGLAVVIIIMFYVDHWSRLAGDFHTPFISYRNFCTTMMMFGMPAACLFIRSSKLHFIGLAFVYFGMLIAGSRSGLLFGTAEFAACLVYVYAVSPQERCRYRRIAAICALPMLAACGFMIYKLFLGDSGRMGEYFVKPTEARVSFYPQGVSDFLERPVFGWGIGNMKNAEIYQGVNGSMIFYHNAVLQVLASMGLVGAAAYLWQLAVRVRLLWQARSTPAFLFVIPFGAVLMMSQTNPGIFCPLPTALLMMLLFAVIEYSQPQDEGSSENR